jgi:hypothetical protein
MKLPKKYLSKNPRVMKREIMKHKDKADSDPSAYKEWDADYKSRKAGKGKPVETKPSKYTKKFKEMYEDDAEVPTKLVSFEEFEIPTDIFEEIVIEEGFTETDLIEEAMSKNSPVYKALKKKSDKTGFPLGILRQVWNRGYAAWKTGHVPGTSPQQWAMARVNSFLVGGRTTEVGDKALYQQAKKNRKEKKKVNEEAEFHTDTVKRFPTRDEMEQINDMDLSSDKVVELFINAILGKDSGNEDSKLMVMQSIQMLCGMYPENPEYAEALDKIYHKFIF